jgi:hypothetical protein
MRLKLSGLSRTVAVPSCTAEPQKRRLAGPIFLAPWRKRAPMETPGPKRVWSWLPLAHKSDEGRQRIQNSSTSHWRNRRMCPRRIQP